MHSKWQIWDFFSSYRRDTFKTFEGIIAFNTFEPTCLKFVKDFLFKDVSDRVVHYKMASEITKTWIEEEFQTLSLFGNQDSFFIHEANSLSLDLAETLSQLSLEGRFIFLSFENDQGAWKKILKEGKIRTVTIEEPRFREYNKLLDFVSSYMRLPLSFDAKNWILESLENDLGTFYNAVFLVKLNYPDSKEVGLSQIKELLTLDKLDRFQLASFFSRKKLSSFYQKLIELEGDFDKMRSFFMFLQSHLVKMIDPSYLGKKSFLTQYDKEIQGTSKIWKTEELNNYLKVFNQWEMLCKKKDELIWAEIKRASLRLGPV